MTSITLTDEQVEALARSLRFMHARLANTAKGKDHEKARWASERLDILGEILALLPERDD